MARKKKISESGSDDNEMDALFADLAKETGGDVLEDLDDVKSFIDTGNLAINYSCSGKMINGGIPQGRIIEAYGPEASGKSLIGSNVLYGIQRSNGYAALLDCENASNGEFMSKISHLNLKRVIRYAPSSLERAFRQIHVTTKAIRDREIKLKQERRPILFVFDSLTVPPCERELKENNLPLDHSVADWKRIVGRHEQPGERARVISAEMRKLQAMVVEQNVTVYIINQTRDKIGVMYGCVSGSTKVSFADGRCLPIKEVVANKMTGPVLSYNFENNKIEPAEITNWFVNGKMEPEERWLHFKIEGGSTGFMGMTLTPDHKVYINGQTIPEMVSAKDLKEGDELISYYEESVMLDNVHREVICGSLLGDGTIRRRKNHTAAFSLANQEQPEYLQWKLSLLPLLAMKKSGNESRPRFDSEYSKEMSLLKEKFYPTGSGYRQIPQDLILTNLMLAIWYMDDGFIKNNVKENWIPTISINIKRFKNKPDQIELAKKIIIDYLGGGFENNDVTYQSSGCNLHLSTKASTKVFENICKHVPNCMNYKIPKNLIEKEKAVIVPSTKKEKVLKPYYVKIISKEIASERIHRSKTKYDIEVSSCGNYLVGGDSSGVMVSNSPETTPGGNAVKFYASLRLRTSTKKKIEHAKLDKFAGINMEVKNVKNRMFRPFVKAEDVKLYFEDGIDPLSGILTSLLEGERIVMKSGGNYEVADGFRSEAYPAEYKFKASKAENRLPVQVILDNPKLVDAETSEEVQAYLDCWKGGLAATESGDYAEKSVAFDPDGNDIAEESEEEKNEE